jgi:hypothetical protein
MRKSEGTRLIDDDEEDEVEQVGIDIAPSASQRPTEIQDTSIFGVIVNLILFVLLWFMPLFGIFFTVAPQQHALVVFWGRLVRVYKKPGLYYFWPFGRSVQYIPTSLQTLDIKKSTVVDRNGNPIVVAGVVTFQLIDTIKAAFDVIDYPHYLERQSLAVLKRVCSMYPYECKTGKSLQSESKEVSRLMVQLLQQKADLAGARIVSYELADLQYAPEIAAGMLVRQQAEALVEARHTIVDGAVQIVSGAVTKLGETGLHLQDREQSRLVSNLLAVICSDSHVTPTFSISESNNEEKAEESEEYKKAMLESLRRIIVNTTPKN